ncbi:MAG: glycogen debranching protein GlgX [Acetobacteraceae bacterium]
MTQFQLTAGTAEPLGASVDAIGVNVAVHSANADTIAFCLFDAEDREIARFRLPERTGDVFHGHVSEVRPGARYGLRAFGPWDLSRGHRFNPMKLLLDPFATAIDRPFRLHPSLFDSSEPHAEDSAPAMPKAIVGTADPPANDRPLFPWRGQVIYELHVRGFTKQHPDIPPEQRGTFAGLAHPAAIGHLRKLGVTTVELMPCAAWIDEPHLPVLGLRNYWGYNPVALLAPDPILAPGGWEEVRSAVDRLHEAGISVIVDIVLNHTGEGDHLGPTLSLRGLDNADYYRLLPDDPARYANDTGCGNTLALDRPAALRLAMAALRTWVLRGGVDGFRLDLATTLGRRPDGFDPTAPLLAAVEQDPLLCRRVMIAEPWDIGFEGYQLGAFPARWGEWNDRFRDTVRRFWRGDSGTVADLATRFAGSADVFDPRRRPLSRGINLITAHDGFTLADLVAYATKHNDANGEANHDGSDHNLSWNNGVEGETSDPAIQAARLSDVRALLATLLFSRGTPLITMGDEAGRTQRGNNNAYAQDNEWSWFNWDRADHTLIDFTARLVAVRRACAVLTGERPLTGRAVEDASLPDVEWRCPDGSPMTEADWSQPDLRTLVAALCGGGRRLLVVLHAGATPIDVALPPPVGNHVWHCEVDSAAPDRSGAVETLLQVAARSVVLLYEQSSNDRRPGAQGVSRERLDELAQVAGIAPVWWDVEGRVHRVGDDTKQAILAAMRLPARTAGDLADSLARLKAEQDEPLPRSFVVRGAGPVTIPLGVRPPAWLTLSDAEQRITRVPVIEARQVTLPPLPIGRYRLLGDDDPSVVCHLTIAPERCHLPDALLCGQRRFGVAAHLYALRRDGDQGIGDFTTLRQLAVATAGRGASVAGLNPLHALVSTDRERASPYHPSDRRFLDPIYIDVAGFPGAPPRQDGSGMVDYAAVWQAKRQVLWAAFRNGGATEPALARFIEAGGEALRRFAVFEAIAAGQDGRAWHHWPESLRHPHAPGIMPFAAAHADEVRFACFLQYIADCQVSAAARAAAEAGLDLGFYLDLAVGAAPDGAEAWSNQETLLPGLSIGAPPDPFAASGQVWCLPPPDPRAMIREGYAGFAELLLANMRHAGALRIDHVMGLRRLFVVPDGASAADGAYLSYPFDDLLAQVALASRQAQCVVVGEALGTVPEGLTRALADADVLSYSVLWFERDGEQFREPGTWSRESAACVSTHDLPTLAGWWEAADLEEQAALGLLDALALDHARAKRRADKQRLVASVRCNGFLNHDPDLDGALPPAMAEAVHRFVADTPAMLALVQADDLAGERIAVNLPGTDRERPNWRRRHAVDITALCRGSDAEPIWRAMTTRSRDANNRA